MSRISYAEWIERYGASRLRDDPMPGQMPESDDAYFSGLSTSLFRLTTPSTDEIRRVDCRAATPEHAFVRIANFEPPRYVVSMIFALKRDYVAVLNRSTDDTLGKIWAELLSEAVRTNNPAYEVIKLPMRRLLS